MDCKSKFEIAFSKFFVPGDLSATVCSVTEEFTILRSREAIVGMATVVLVGNYEDILTRARAMSSNNWAHVFHALAHVGHLLLFVALLHLPLNFCLGVLSQFLSALIVKLSSLKSDELLSFFYWVITRIRIISLLFLH